MTNYNQSRPSSFNRQQAYWSPAVRNAVLQNRAVEIEAWANERKLKPEVLFGIAEATLRLGRVPDMGFYGLSPDDAYAYSAFLQDVILNVAEDGEDKDNLDERNYSNWGATGLKDVSFDPSGAHDEDSVWLVIDGNRMLHLSKKQARKIKSKMCKLKVEDRASFIESVIEEGRKEKMSVEGAKAAIRPVLARYSDSADPKWEKPYKGWDIQVEIRNGELIDLSYQFDADDEEEAEELDSAEWAVISKIKKDLKRVLKGAKKIDFDYSEKGFGVISVKLESLEEAALPSYVNDILYQAEKQGISVQRYHPKEFGFHGDKRLIAGFVGDVLDSHPEADIKIGRNKKHIAILSLESVDSDVSESMDRSLRGAGRRALADPQDPGAMRDYIRSVARSGKSVIDLGKKVQERFGELAGMFNLNDPFKFWTESSDTAEALLLQKAKREKNYRVDASFSSGWKRGHPGFKNHSSRALDSYAGKIGIPSDQDFSHKFVLGHHVVGMERFEDKDGQPWRYELSADGISGVITRSKGKWSVLTKRVDKFTAQGEQDEPDYEDYHHYEDKNMVTENAAKKYEGKLLKGADPIPKSLWDATQGRKKIGYITAGNNTLSIGKSRKVFKNGWRIVSPVYDIKPILRAGFDVQGYGADEDGLPIWEINLSRKGKTVAEGIEEASMSGGMGAFVSHFQNVMQRTQNQLKSDDETQKGKVSAPWAYQGDKSPVRRPPGGPGSSGSVAFRKGAWTMGDLDLGESVPYSIKLKNHEALLRGDDLRGDLDEAYYAHTPYHQRSPEGIADAEVFHQLRMKTRAHLQPRTQKELMKLLQTRTPQKAVIQWFKDNGLKDPKDYKYRLGEEAKDLQRSLLDTAELLDKAVHLDKRKTIRELEGIMDKNHYDLELIPLFDLWLDAHTILPRIGKPWDRILKDALKLKVLPWIKRLLSF